MAFNDDVVEQRLSGLNESHDSISTTAQWLMFHRRHAERIVTLWMNRMQDSSSNKRLNLLYLANDVCQKSKIRSRDEFPVAFSTVVADSIEMAYKAAPQNIRGKLAHVVGVWKERNIFEPPIQASVEARIQELDRIRNGSQTPAFSSGGEEVPPKLKALVVAFQGTSKQAAPAAAATTSASQDYEKLMDPSNPVLAPPVFAARLNGVLNTLGASHTTVAGYVKARKGLVAELEALLASNKSQLEEDEKNLAQLTQRKDEIETKKHEVEMEIMRGLEPAHDVVDQQPSDGCLEQAPVGMLSTDLEAPEVEALTPPSAEEDDYEPAAPEIETLDIASEPARKRRRVDSADDDFPDLGQDDGIDADVAEMLRDTPAVGAVPDSIA